MKIGIDIDDTTFVTVKSMLKYADKFQEEIFGTSTTRDNFGLITNQKYLNVLYGWDDATKHDFFVKYYKQVLEDCTMMTDANSVIKKLKDQGDKIYFVTSRLMDIPGCDAEAITKKSLAAFDIPYDKLFIHINDKVDFFKKHGINLCIEDSFNTCNSMMDSGIPAILMTTKMNEKLESGRIKRVHNWIDIYKAIEQMREQNSR